MKARLIAWALVLSAGSLACLSLFSGEPSGAADPDDRPISVILVPHERATLSAEVPSTVENILKEMGQIFKAGEALIQLDKTIYAANRDKARAQVASAKAQFQSKQNLLVDGGASVTEVETARMDLAVAQANLVLAEKRLSACTIRAPYEGRVVKVHVHKHEVVQPGQKLVDIVDDRVLRAQFLVSSTALPHVKLDATVAIEVFETKSVVQATISHVGAVIDPASSSVKVFAEVANQDRKLRGGMRGTVRLSPRGN